MGDAMLKLGDCPGGDAIERLRGRKIEAGKLAPERLRVKVGRHRPRRHPFAGTDQRLGQPVFPALALVPRRKQRRLGDGRRIEREGIGHGQA